MKKIVVIGGVVIVAAAVISPYYMGKRIESSFEQKVTALNNKIDKYFHVKDFVKLEYKAGWFSSTAKTMVGDQVINHSITHGPYCFLGLGRIESTFEVPENRQQKYDELKAFFNDQDPYTMTTEVSYTGTTYFNFHSPAIGEKSLPKKPDSKITWQGLDFSAKFTKNEVESSFEMPKFVFSEKDKGIFSIEGLKSKGKSDRLFDNELNFNLPAHFNINSTASLDKITLSVLDSYMPVNLEINKLVAHSIGKNNNVTAEFSVDKVAGTVKDTSVSVDNIKMKSENVDALWILRSDLAKANWAGKTIMDIANVKVNAPSSATDIVLNYHQEQEFLDDGNKVGYGELYKATDINAQLPVPNYSNFIKQVEFGYKIAGLPKEQTAEVLKDYIETIKFTLLAGLTQGIAGNYNVDYSAMAQQQSKLMQSAQKWGIASLQETPSFESHLNLQGDKGKADVNFNASLVKPDDATDPQQLMINAIPRANAKVSIKIPKALVQSLLEVGDISDEQLIQIEQQVKERFPSIIKSDEYSVDIEFKGGQFFVNGQPDPEFTRKALSTFR